MYSTFLTFIIPANKNSYVQSHPKAKRFMTKSFPLFDDLVELCDAVIVMGVGHSGAQVIHLMNRMLGAQLRRRKVMRSGTFPQSRLGLRTQLALRKWLFQRIGI